MISFAPDIYKQNSIITDQIRKNYERKGRVNNLLVYKTGYISNSTVDHQSAFPSNLLAYLLTYSMEQSPS